MQAANRAKFFLDVASDPFYDLSREGAEVPEAAVGNWRRRGALRLHQGVAETDFTGAQKRRTACRLA